MDNKTVHLWRLFAYSKFIFVKGIWWIKEKKRGTVEGGRGEEIKDGYLEKRDFQGQEL